MKMKKKKNDAKQDLLLVDTETGLLSHPSTLECVSPNSGILFPNLFGASNERITLYKNLRINSMISASQNMPLACTSLEIQLLAQHSK